MLRLVMTFNCLRERIAKKAKQTLAVVMLSRPKLPLSRIRLAVETSHGL